MTVEVAELVTDGKVGGRKGQDYKGRSGVGPPFLLGCLAGWKCMVLEETAGREVWELREEVDPGDGDWES